MNRLKLKRELVAIFMKALSYSTSIVNRLAYSRVQRNGYILINLSIHKQTYEEMFLKVNSLEASNAGKNKSKDVHLPSIDVTFGSNRIL